MKRSVWLFAAATAALASPSSAQTGADAGRTLAATCANCHGTTGQSRGSMPPIAGQSKADLVQKMNDFRDGKRPATIMHQLAKGYTPEQIDAIAEWLAAQKTR